ncbi:hypothetical protein AIOL_004011 [Candidatus Rhodobacter oscarellae]|uniref:Uncharacterized protein n=1 Tax=Candidatus Rhodobacter oscarellae TaxID=1675527 RepID=A0A0J9E8F6_9RHOB|nr:hypothetical protein [Candidatus Rhodobacter lobularis]KMW59030.1 hypothetical protein AIOL_004011 [Candidatus Rhodobacter lobularis]
MIRILTLILICLLPAAELAAQNRVQSGNHASFVRLVLYFDEEPEWAFGRVEGGYEFRAPNAVDGYAIESVFDRIPQDRLADLRDEGDGRLSLGVECDCHAVAFVIAEGIVLDVRDGDAPEGSAFEASLVLNETIENETIESEVEQAQETSPVPLLDQSGTQPFVAMPMMTTGAIADLAQRYTAARTQRAWSRNLAVRAEPIVPKDGPVRPPQGEEMGADVEMARDGRVDTLEADLIEQIGRAASQGLVVADLTETLREMERGIPAERDAADMEEKPADVAANTSLDHVRLQTAIDRGIARPSGPNATTTSGATCLRDELFEVASWGIAENTEDGFFVGRTALVGEFDAVDKKAVSEMAKKYIFLTFGAETRALLDAFGDGIKHREVMLALADIMDHGESESGAIPMAQVSCEARVAFWAMLAHPDLDPALEVATQPVLGAFSELPLHLRRHLGPHLAHRFLSVGDVETAKEISSAISRAPGDPGPHFEMLSGELALADGNPNEAIGHFEDVFRNDGQMAAEAVIRLVDESVNNGVDLPPRMPTATAAMAHEAEGTTVGSELLRVQIRAQANNGDVVGAIKALVQHEADGALMPQQASVLREELFELAVATTSDADFVEVALDRTLVSGDNQRAVEIRRQIAARLVDIGLSARARGPFDKRNNV